MKKIFKYILPVLLITVTLSCNEDELLDDWLAQNEQPSVGDAGSLDLTKYVALGNSLTAGFTDAALNPQGQANSYPSILAKQFALVGGGPFNYPNVSSGNGFGGLNEDLSARGKSYIDVAAALVNPANAIQFTDGSFLSANTTSSLSNFGVPGARMIDATNSGYGHPSLGNPFFASFASSPGTSSMLADAATANGSFFSVWLGSNDVLGYATGGGTDEAQITSQGDFATALTTVLTTLSAGGAEGVILTVPPVTLVPYFQIVTSLSGGVKLFAAGAIPEANIDALNSGYADYNAGLDAVVGAPVTPTPYSPGGTFTQTEANMRKIVFAYDDGQPSPTLVRNAPVITDESLTDLSGYGLPNYRQAQVINGVSDLFPLPALAALLTGQGSASPLQDQYTLTVSEQVNVITGYATFNGVIAAVAPSFPNVTIVDVGPMFADIFGLIPAQAAGLQLSSAAQAAADGVLGTQVGGYNMVPLDLGNSLFQSIWSSDGIHPNHRGAALVANEIIKTLNAKYNATIPLANPLDYLGINAVLPSD